MFENNGHVHLYSPGQKQKAAVVGSCKPHVYYIKVGYKEYKLHGRVIMTLFRMFVICLFIMKFLSNIYTYTNTYICDRDWA